MEFVIKNSLTNHIDGLRINHFSDDPALRGDVFDHFEKCAAFNFFPFQITQGIGHKVEKNTALLDLLHKQLLFICWGCV